MTLDWLGVSHVFMRTCVQVISFPRRIIGSKSYSEELILGFECR